MRTVLCFVLLAPVLALAAATTRPLTAIASENGAVSPAVTSVPATRTQRQPNVPPRALVGTIDTIGGTTFDWQANGPAYRMLVNSPANGVHVAWMYSSATTGQDFPDRNMRYNFYDITTRTWNWIDANYMQSGVSIFSKRAGYGSIDTDLSGIAFVSAHSFVDSPNIMPWVARDAAPGAGIFEYSDTLDLGICQWPPIAVNQNGNVNIFPMTAAYDMSYSNITPGNWPNFSTPVTGVLPSPGFPSHNIAASKASDKVTLVWEVSTGTPQDAYQMNSTDGGMTWDTPANLALPAAYGGDTVTSCHITSLFPWYDRQDRFHIVANLMPMVNDTGYIIPSQIWHYCPDNSPQWSRIHTAAVDPANFLYALTINATLACRPSIGQDDDGHLFVAWEQFDTLNYEPSTSRARADIFVALSDNNGANWGVARKLTDAGSYSMRFPSVIDLAVEGGDDDDTIYLTYEIDSVSGFYVAAGTTPSEGPATPNPIVVQKVPIRWDGVAGPPAAAPLKLSMKVEPSPFHGRTHISYALPQPGPVLLEVFDLAGRSVARPVDGFRSAGQYSATLSAKGLVPGVYVARLSAGGRCTTRKLVLTE